MCWLSTCRPVSFLASPASGMLNSTLALLSLHPSRRGCVFYHGRAPRHVLTVTSVTHVSVVPLCWKRGTSLFSTIPCLSRANWRGPEQIY
ncbi:hypothetical protein EXIGLDRAFT_318577 [Exidia glandulosa HHB12029]|uniref:Uncharacterized protein n=1 Tax=Exidia glandulosa HHB12029 TaxID=1314781 RepID=A0A166BPQ9_EXIGL|nr:hypothetical protein EXIGLDRAFT_318577 [Exidia glandulosa HHB12029]